MDTMNRERGSGRYKFTIDRACGCGHTLGEHLAERSKDADGQTRQECLGESCACECFKPARKPRVAK